MRHRNVLALVLPLVLTIVLFAAPQAAARIQPGIFRDPALSATHVAFVAGDALWLMPRTGGTAVKLLAAPNIGSVQFSPDGKALAFGAGIASGQDLYTLPITGGTPHRVTYFPSGKGLSQWHRDRGLVFYGNPFSVHGLMMRLFTVSPNGGLPQPLPIPTGADAVISADGEWAAYVTIWPNNLIRSWKRYTGGMAQDIWLFNLKTKASRRATTWMGTDTRPVWAGKTLYYLSDGGPEHRMNVWSLDTRTNARRQVTSHRETDVKGLTGHTGQDGRATLVAQVGPDLEIVDPATGKAELLSITLPSGAEKVDPKQVDAARYIVSARPSPSGDAAVMEARGDLWVVPARGGEPTNLTRTSGVFERDPAWSPDGKWIAFFSDEPGSYELYVVPAAGGARRQLTRLGPGFRYQPTWSPDSASLAFVDQSNSLHICSLQTGATTKVDREERDARPEFVWSPDSRTIAYTKRSSNRLGTLRVYDTGSRTSRQVTAGMVEDSSPCFGADGRTLYYVSRRDFSSPVFDTFDTTYVHPVIDTLVSINLTVADPEARSSVHRTDAGRISGVQLASDGRVVYGHATVDGRTTVRIRKPNDTGDTVLFEGTNQFELSGDGKRLLARTGGDWRVAEVAAGTQTGEPVRTAGMSVTIDPRAEWREIFQDAWRLFRDLFYDPGMHGVDWQATRERYAPWVERCLTRNDLNFVLEEMLAELSAGHIYLVNVGDVTQTPAANVGTLGADFDLDQGAYRFRRIYLGTPFATVRSPLGQPGVDVREGDYLLAIDGQPVDAGHDPWAALQGKAGRKVTLTISRKPTPGPEDRKVEVTPAGSEVPFRHAEHVEAVRQAVAEKSGGRVGYIHLSDFNPNGANELMRQLYAQIDREALIVDARWSQGGFLGDVFAKTLDRKVFQLLGNREAETRMVPWRANFGPKCVVMNAVTVSAGENFAYFFRQNGVGKLVGARTWGGIIGLAGNPSFIDGGMFNIPNAPFYGRDGRWMIEGHGIEPDLTIENDPTRVAAGEDPQLERAIRLMLDELRTKSYRVPPMPPARNRTGMGVPKRER